MHAAIPKPSFAATFRWRAILVACGIASGIENASAVMFLETGDPQFNTTTPGDNSGWQYTGKFGAYALGVPIAPHFFITSGHLQYVAIGSTFDFRGEIYTTIDFHNVPGTDMRIWEVDHSTPFPNYAPVSSGTADVGATATVIGRGTRRGTAIFLSSELKGWQWGASDDVPRWGRNIVEGMINSSAGELLYCDFNNPGIPFECHLSVGDSGGGLFVLEDGLWRLAGINYTVDGRFREPPSGTPFVAALTDTGGYDREGQPNVWNPQPDQATDIPSAFYSSRLSASRTWIAENLAPEVNTLVAESYETWLPLYFSPTQIGNPSLTGRLADFDKDGIGNLLEFALNLDPSFNETAVMVAGTGLRGLPLVQIETDGPHERLTIEFVRRTAGSGATLDYLPEFSSDLVTWSAGSPPVVQSINPRWERVKVADTVPKSASARRFARLRVVEDP